MKTVHSVKIDEILNSEESDNEDNDSIQDIENSNILDEIRRNILDVSAGNEPGEKSVSAAGLETELDRFLAAGLAGGFVTGSTGELVTDIVGDSGLNFSSTSVPSSEIILPFDLF